jgi:ATP-dependent DNA ligase
MLRVTHPGLGFIEPCLPSPAKAPPTGPGWLHEINHDGFRIVARRATAEERHTLIVAMRFFIRVSRATIRG